MSKGLEAGSSRWIRDLPACLRFRSAICFSVHTRMRELRPPVLTFPLLPFGAICSYPPTAPSPPCSQHKPMFTLFLASFLSYKETPSSYKSCCIHLPPGHLCSLVAHLSPCTSTGGALASWLFLKPPSSLPPQGLCTCFSRDWNCFSSDISWPICSLHSGLCLNVTSAEVPSRTLSKTLCDSSPTLFCFVTVFITI